MILGLSKGNCAQVRINIHITHMPNSQYSSVIYSITEAKFQPPENTYIRMLLLLYKKKKDKNILATLLQITYWFCCTWLWREVCAPAEDPHSSPPPPDPAPSPLWPKTQKLNAVNSQSCSYCPVNEASGSIYSTGRCWILAMRLLRTEMSSAASRAEEAQPNWARALLEFGSIVSAWLLDTALRSAVTVGLEGA